MKQEIIELNELAKQGKLLCIDFSKTAVSTIDTVVDSVNLTAIGTEMESWPVVKLLHSKHLVFTNQMMYVINDDLGIRTYASYAGRAMFSGKRLEMANTLLTDIGVFK